MAVSASSNLHESHLSHEDNSDHKFDVEEDGKVDQLCRHPFPERWYSTLHPWNKTTTKTKGKVYMYAYKKNCPFI